MIALYLAVLIFPALIIFCWDRLVMLFWPQARKVYEITGLIGTPIHELSHAIGCVLFGLRITGMRLYAPNKETGVMGYVNFRYNPGSLRHQIGCIFQGISPLIAGGLIVYFCLDASLVNVVPDRTSVVAKYVPEASAFDVLNWLFLSAVDTLRGTLVMFSSGLAGAFTALLLVVICMHAIPSVSDIKIGLGGFLAVAALVFLIWFLLDVLVGVRLSGLLELNFVSKLSLAIENSLWWMLYASCGVIVLAIVGTICFVLLPAAIASLFRLSLGRSKP